MLYTKVFVTSGIGVHTQDKNARHAAKQMAGIDRQNHRPLTSVLPPGIRFITRQEYLDSVRPGQVVDSILGMCLSDVPGQMLCAGLAWVRARGPERTGFISEIYEHPGISRSAMRYRVETSALQLFAQDCDDGQFAADDVYEQGVLGYRIGGVDVEVGSTIIDIEVPVGGEYGCALVAAVFLP
jgi:pyruvoyl-dependent arginine decarboxylase